MKEKKIACFDIDGTLVEGVSWLLLTSGLGCLPKDHLDIFRRAKEGIITFVEGEKQLTQLWREKGQAIKEKVRKVFSETDLIPGAVQTINRLKQNGWSVYLMSGAIDIYVEEVAKKVKADGWFANSTLDFDRGGKLSAIHYRDNQGRVKFEQLRELAAKLRVPITDIIFVGNGANDIEVFEATGRGIAVYAEPELLTKAWRTADNISQVSEILLSKNSAVKT
jgi:phosphoserine phosphatase